MARWARVMKAERRFRRTAQEEPTRLVGLAARARVFAWRTAVKSSLKTRFIALLAAAATMATATAPFPAPAAAQDTLTVFAAASMKNALDDVNKAFAGKEQIKVTASYAASSALIKQIEAGAPADVFISADLDWMKYGLEKKAIKPGSDFQLLGNRLVLIAPKDSKTSDVKIAPGFDIVGAAGGGRIATGDVRAVPVGKYARAALEKLGVWNRAEAHMAMAENVRAALALVGRGEAPLGIVYETDAKVEPNVKIVAAFPQEFYPPVIYPAGLTVNAKPEAAKYLAFLRSDAAKAILERYGFTFLAKANVKSGS
jgi:molybdate transport system substrate-binding protein